MKFIIAIVAAVLLGSTIATLMPQSFAHSPEGVGVPAEYFQFVGGQILKNNYNFNLLTIGRIVTGDEIEAEATFGGNSVVKQVRFLWLDGTKTPIEQTIVPRSEALSWSVLDTFDGLVRLDTPLTVITCYEDPEGPIGMNTLHIDVLEIDIGSFFVLPESGAGAIAVVMASLGAVGGYIFLRRDIENNLLRILLDRRGLVHVDCIVPLTTFLS